MEIQFLGYKATPGEKFLGIASVSFDNKIVLRYKIVQGKDGKGFFPASSSYKIGDSYVATFLIDSNIVKERVESCIRDGVKQHIGSVSDEEPAYKGKEEDFPF